MADMLDLNATFGKGQNAQQASPSAQPSSGQPSGMLDLNATFGKGAQGKSESSKSDDEYESKVQSLMPKAREYVDKDSGTLGAFTEGLGKPGEWLGLRTATRGAMAALGAGEGKNFSERYNQLKAEDEAVSRAYDEKHGLAKGLGEFAGVAAAVPAGFVAAPVEGALASRGVGAGLSSIAGMGAEGAAVGAGTAAAEQAFGTKTAKDEPGIASSALIGGGLGAGLGAAAKGVSTAFQNFAPEWLKGLGNKDAYQMKTFVQKWMEDVENGSAKMNLNEYKDALEKGQPVNLLDIGGDNTQEWLRKAFKNRGDALEEFKIKTADRLSGEGERFDKFLQKYAGEDGYINQDQIKKAAQEYASAVNDANYQRSAWLPENGKGKWLDRWMTNFDDPDVSGAFNDAVQAMSRKYKDKFINPLSSAGEQNIDSLNLNKRTTDYLKSINIDKVGDLAGLSEPELIDKLTPQANKDFVGPSKPSPLTGKNFLGDIVNDIQNATKKVDPKSPVINPDNVNVEFLDRWQRALNRRADILERTNPEQNMDFVKRLRDLQGDIVGSLKNKNGSLYNEAFDTAHTQAAQFHRQNDAFTMGQTLLNKLTNGEVTTSIVNATKEMTPPEKSFFIKGLLGQMVEKGLRGGSEGRNINYQTLKNWMSNPNVVTALKNTIGENQFDGLRAFLKAEIAMNDSAKVAQRYGHFTNDYGGYLPMFLSGYLEHAIYAHAPVSPFVIGAYKAADHYLGRRFASSLSDKMLSNDPKLIEEALDSIHRNPKMYEYFTHYVGTRMPQMMGVMAGGHADGGAVKGYAFGGAPNEMRVANKSVVLPKPGDPNFVGPTMTSSSYDPNKSHVFDRLNVMRGDNPIWTPNLGNASARGYAVDKSGRSIMRSTGGRIPEADKLFKQAKKYVDSHTKNLLNAHDDDIVKALRVAAKRV
jgi:hypothetical protein